MLGLSDTNPATHDAVTSALPDHDCVHFACHGYSDLDNPSASYLLLADRPLSVTDLTHMRLPNAELAFLSACTTARAGTALPDEPIHLAAACQLAGYRHVIASLWPISDTDTVWLAETFYGTVAIRDEKPGRRRCRSPARGYATAAPAQPPTPQPLGPLHPHRPLTLAEGIFSTRRYDAQRTTGPVRRRYEMSKPTGTITL